jgi:uncharacterized membrane protein YkvA (DUF1232 family)
MAPSPSGWTAPARALKREVRTLVIVWRHPRVRWYTRALALLVLAYAASPIDLVPDFIPVVGLLDDLLLLPIGVWLVLKTLPSGIVEECRGRAEAVKVPMLWKVVGVVLVVVAWIGAAAIGWWLVVPR